MFNTIIEALKNSISIFTLRDLIDILLVAFILYQILMITRNTRGFQLLKGLVFILLLSGLMNWLRLSTISWLLNQALYVSSIAIIVIFQPEWRRGLERLGRGYLRKEESGGTLMPEEQHSVDGLVEAMLNMSKRRIGALIVIEGNTGLLDIVATGTRIEGRISAALVEQIFEPNTPLHDGAVVISDNSILSAGCILPLSENYSISKSLGTRHRAALGLSEVSDASILIVSEETGDISYARGGKLERRLSENKLRDKLTAQYSRPDVTQQWWRLWPTGRKEGK